MATVGEAKLRMWVQTSQLKKGLTSADSAISSFASRVKGAGSSIISAFGSIGLAINGVSLISKGLIAGISGPLKLAADAEQTAVSFKVMLGSAEAAGEMMKTLTQFAASTPFEMTEITDSAKKLLAFGVAAEDIEPTLRNLGNVSAGIGAPMNELAEIFGKIKTSGRVMGEDINQLSGRGIPIQALLAKQFGVTGEAIKKMVSDGKVNFSHIDKAFADMSASGGQFEGLMEAQSKTLGGVWSTMKDGVTLALTEIGAAVADTFDLKGAALGVSGMIETVMPMIRSFLASFKETFISVKPVIFEVVNTLIAWWSMLWDIGSTIFMGIGEVVLSFLPSFTTMKEAVISGLNLLQFTFQNWSKFLKHSILSVILGFAQLANSAGYYLWTVAGAYLLHFGDMVYDLFTGVAISGFNIFANLSRNIVNVFKNLPGLIAGTTNFSELWKPLTEGAAIAIREMEEIPERVKGGLEINLEREVNALSQDIAKSYEDFEASKIPPITTALDTVIEKAEEVKAVTENIGVSTVMKSKLNPNDFKGIEGIQDLKVTFPEVEPLTQTLASADEFGSAEARSSIIKHRFGSSDPSKKAEKTQTQQLITQQQSAKYLKTISEKEEDEVFVF